MLAFAILGLLRSSAGAAELPEQAEGIRNYKRLSPALAVAGTPDAEALGRLKLQGLATVIDLRGPEEGADAEQKAAGELGLRYVNVPVRPETFSSKDVDAVMAVLDDPAAGPVLLHCAASNRVGGVWAVIESRRGQGLGEALARGEQAGLRSPAMIEAARRVIEAEKTRARPAR